MTYVYEVDGYIAHTQPCAAGSWDPSMQHGGAPAAPIAWAIERMPTRDPMQVVRMTLDLLRPIPVAPLEIKIDIPSVPGVAPGSRFPAPQRPSPL